jgi:hypothetical protein
MKNILLIAASAVMILASCSKEKEAPRVHVSANVYVKNGEANYTVMLKVAPGIQSTGSVTVSWRSAGGTLSKVVKPFAMNGEQVYSFATSVSSNAFPGVKEIKIESFTGTGGYSFSY